MGLLGRLDKQAARHPTFALLEPVRRRTPGRCAILCGRSTGQEGPHRTLGRLEGDEPPRAAAGNPYVRRLSPIPGHPAAKPFEKDIVGGSGADALLPSPIAGDVVCVHGLPASGHAVQGKRFRGEAFEQTGLWQGRCIQPDAVRTGQPSSHLKGPIPGRRNDNKGVPLARPNLGLMG